MDAVDKARELGTEHGRKAGEAWHAFVAPPDGLYGAYCQRCNGDQDSHRLPEPDPSGDYDIAQELDGCGDRWENLIDAYSAAFTAAVEAVVRERVES